MKYLSVCSGIEAATVAWHPLGWKPVAFSEIDPFPCKVLAHHYPDVPNFGDMTKFKEWPDANVDVLVGGTPCQSFSIAGLRKGLDDPRGNLMLTYLAIAAKYQPRWLVWENVPGVLSSNGGRDFASLLRGMGQLGYGFAYRVLDAQYFGVPQRRRRVFVVGCLGDWRSAAAVLFERHSLHGHPAPSREKGKEVAPTITAGAANGGKGHGARSGDSKDELIVPVIAGALTAHAFSGGAGGRPEGAAGNHFIPVETLCVATGQAGAEIGVDMAPTLNCNHEAPYVAHSLRGEGFDASEDGTGRGTPLVPLAFDTTQITSAANFSNPKPGDPCHPLAAGAHAPAIAFHASQDPDVSGDLAAPLGAQTNGMTNGVAVALQSSQSGVRLQETHATLDANNGPRRHNGVVQDMQVRRLTPRECERLQGFPDDYTAIPWRKKPASECPDGPRYKALGNSMAVPVMHWIGQRIKQVSEIKAMEIAA